MNDMNPFLTSLPIVIRVSSVRTTPNGSKVLSPNNLSERVWARVPNNRAYPSINDNSDIVSALKVNAIKVPDLLGFSRLQKQRGQV
jgi:hypothetical protein